MSPPAPSTTTASNFRSYTAKANTTTTCPATARRSPSRCKAATGVIPSASCRTRPRTNTSRSARSRRTCSSKANSPLSCGQASSWITRRIPPALRWPPVLPPKPPAKPGRSPTSMPISATTSPMTATRPPQCRAATCRTRTPRWPRAKASALTMPRWPRPCCAARASPPSSSPAMSRRGSSTTPGT